MKPTKPIALVTDRQRFRDLRIQRSNIAVPGRVIFWAGRKIAGHADVAGLDVNIIPKGAEAMSVSPADYDDVREWLCA